MSRFRPNLNRLVRSCPAFSPVPESAGLDLTDQARTGQCPRELTTRPTRVDHAAEVHGPDASGEDQKVSARDGLVHLDDEPEQSYAARLGMMTYFEPVACRP